MSSSKISLVFLASQGNLLSKICDNILPILLQILNFTQSKCLQVIAIFETYFTYMLEFVGGAYSTVIGIGVEFIWVAGWLLLGGLAYAFRDWRQLVLIYSAPSLASLVLYWLLPEAGFERRRN